MSVLALLAATGCGTTAGIAPAQLGRLHGFDARSGDGAARTVDTLDGRALTFDGESTLRLDLHSQPAAGRYQSIQVSGDLFAGTMADGRRVQVPLSQIQGATVDNPPSARTKLIVLFGLLAGFAAAGFLLTAATPTAVPGRALRLRRKILLAPIGSAADWQRELRPDLSDLSADARAALAGYWKDAALGEHASVPAFSRLSMTLMALGAPGRLVDAAHRAAREEIEHARLAFAMASAYAGHPVAPGPLVALADAPAITATSLRALAAESVVDGCLLEGFAAATLAAGQARAEDPAVRDVLATLARDEASHAQLAWDIVAWCVEQEGPELAASLLALVVDAATPAPPAGFATALEAELGRHGWRPPSEWRQLFAASRAAVAEELRELGAQGAAAA